MSSGNSSLNPSQLRAETARRLWRVLNKETSESLDAVLKPALSSSEQQSWMSAALYGALRFYPRYKNQLYRFLAKPIKPKEGEVEALLILGMHQLSAMRVKAHAAINETVNACRALEKDWAIKLVNGILRNYLRELNANKTDESDHKRYKNEIDEFAHPKWIMKTFKKDWPDQWRDILLANNRQAAMTLRVNTAQLSRNQAIQLLADAGIACSKHELVPTAIILDKAVDVTEIPQFNTGMFSVQDAAAQLAALLLINDVDCTQTSTVLDACAAPGGKTGHILERLSDTSTLYALDVSESRLNMIRDNMSRLGFDSRDNFHLTCADANDLDVWYPASANSDVEPMFDKILLDAPCTASGVIRRHPDIKIRRTPQQLHEVVSVQATMLHTLWSTLRTGGQLLYATCSVFKAENYDQIKSFVSTHTDAKVIPLDLPESVNSDFGSQILPGSFHRDGFFYALLEKTKTPKV